MAEIQNLTAGKVKVKAANGDVFKAKDLNIVAAPEAGGPAAPADDRKAVPAGQPAAIGLDEGMQKPADADIKKQLLEITQQLVKLVEQLTLIIAKLIPGAPAGKGGPEGTTLLPLGPLPKEPAAPAPASVPQPGPVGGWLAQHGQYKKNPDGSFSISGGPLAGATAVPTSVPGQFKVSKPGEPEKIFQTPKQDSGKIASPLTFDLNRDGKVGTTSVDGGKAFDIDGDGKVDQTAWAAKGDGVLAFDGDGNGVAGENGKELLGNNTDVDGKKFANGFEALRALADKHLGVSATADGKLSADELGALEQKAGLSMMVDGQKKSLADLGITEIKLGYAEAGANADENGNEHRQVGQGFVRNGETNKVNDAWFKYQ